MNMGENMYRAARLFEIGCDISVWGLDALCFWNVDVLEYLGHEMEKFCAYFSVA
jgi:hypothetical protein